MFPGLSQRPLISADLLILNLLEVSVMIYFVYLTNKFYLHN